MNQLADVLGVDAQVLTTTITDVYGKKGTTDQSIIAIDVNPENRQGSIEVLGHEVSHNQGLSNEKLAHLSGKATDLGFTAGVTANKEAVNTYQQQIGDGKDAATQVNNAVVLKLDNQQFFDKLNANPNDFEDYTTTNMAFGFAEKMNTALKNNNQNEAKRLLNIYSDYMTKQYNVYQKEDAKSIFAVPSVNIDGVTRQANVPVFLTGEQFKQYFSMFPKGSAEYNEIQKLAGMQDEIYKKYDWDMYRGYYSGTDKLNFVYPDQANYGLLPEHYQKQGISADPTYVQKIKADSARGANAIIAAAVSPVGALGSASRIVGVDDKTADNLAIGGGVISTVVGLGIATRTGGLNDTSLGKSEVVVPIKAGVNNTNTNNYINSGNNVYVRLETDGKIFLDNNQSLRSDTKRDPNVPTLIADRVNKKMEKNPDKELPNANMATAHGEIGALQQVVNVGMAKNADIILNVKGKDVCGYCKGDIAAMAEKAGVNSVTIHANKDKPNSPPVTYIWKKGMKSIQEVKK